jgi:hypothetical protein
MQFYLQVTRNFTLHTEFISGTWVTCHVFANVMRTALRHSDYTVSRGGVWLLQKRESFAIHTVGKSVLLLKI